ncbi:spore germination protein [Neobacillus terrae]|uniref:spore germination protein n=1 Tax=Neobacillus terrae TaxID=3034837 RepID=UPI00140AF690|nr:hypothetical protein [Neobacillus terrae]
MAIRGEGIYINTISGGIVNFGGAVYISPISITNNLSGSGSSNSGGEINGTADTSALGSPLTQMNEQAADHSPHYSKSNLPSVRGT